MNAVGAPDDGRMFKLSCARTKRFNQLREIPFEQQNSSLPALHGEGGIDHIARSHAEMDKA